MVNSIKKRNKANLYNYPSLSTMLNNMKNHIIETWDKLPGNCFTGQYEKNYVSSDNDAFSGITDDIIVEILSRLSTEDVLACKLVCVNWHLLISSHYFAQTHVKKSSQVSIISSSKSKQNGVWSNMLLLFQDDENTKVHKLSFEVPSIHLLSSCNGLLLFRTLRTSTPYALYNPLTRQVATLTPKDGHLSICGFFFDELRNVYTLITYSLSHSGQYLYALHELGTKKQTSLGASQYCPFLYDGISYLSHADAVFLRVNFGCQFNCSPQCSLYIMVVKLDTGKMIIMPHPTDKFHQTSESLHMRMRLVDMRDGVAFTELRDNLVNVWVLNDLTEFVRTEHFVWTKRYVVDFDSMLIDMEMEILGIMNGELLLNLKNKRLVWYNPRSMFIRGIKSRSQMKSSEIMKGVTYVKSLVSPKMILGQ